MIGLSSRGIENMTSFERAVYEQILTEFDNDEGWPVDWIESRRLFWVDRLN